MPIVIDQFIKQLEESGVVSSGKLAQFLPPNAYPKDAQELARQLVQSKHLSKYQAQEIYAGRARALLLGNYTIVDKIGAGGMGQVFKAEHRRMKRMVALKMLPTSVTKDAAAVARFQREVEAAARLRHTNIVAADDSDEAGGVHFLVMEYVDGKDLSALVKEHGPFPIAKAVECIRQAALGLAYAHKRGVIHRDIKPANLLLDSEGTVKILDMGLARLEGQLHDAESVAGLTQSGQVMGTVDYMSPEQAEETRGVDARADQYSLGCTLWVLLTGRPMFGGTTTIAKLMAHRTAPIPSLRAARADVPEALEAVYRKMVAKEPDDRYKSMEEVIAALATCLGETAPASLDGPSSSDSRLTEFFQQIAGVKMAAPPKSITAVDAETQQRQPVKEETGTEHKLVAPMPGEATQPLVAASATKASSPAAAEPRSIAVEKPVAKMVVTARPTKVKRKLHPLALAAIVAIAGISSMGLLLGLVLWFVLLGADPATNTEPTTVAVNEPIAPPPLSVAPFDAATAKRHQEAWAEYLGLPVEKEIDLPGGAKLTMVLIPPGEFLMGSTDEERTKFLAEATAAQDQMAIDLIPSEGPQHRVRITKPLYLGKYEVTQAQWESLMGSNPSQFKDDPSHPVEMVSWGDIQPFLAKLNESAAAAGMEFVLPTEAQWEYACRAGTTTSWHSGDSEERLRQYGWFNANAGGKSHPVGQLRANGFELYDMHGNVWELCADWQASDYYAKSPVDDPTGSSVGSRRVGRGGCWLHFARLCRSASRCDCEPGIRNNHLGFRLAAAIDTAQLAGQSAGATAPTTVGNYALEFDGVDDYVDIPSLTYHAAQPHTLEAWVAAARPEVDATLITMHGEHAASLRLWDKGWSACRYLGPSHERVHAADYVPVSGDRVHLASVWDGKQPALYVNGKKYTELSTGGAGPYAKRGIVLGGFCEGEGKPGYFFPGRIDAVRISKIARYSQDFTPKSGWNPDQKTLALYHFDEGRGDQLRDSSGHGHHGRIVGAKWVESNPAPSAALYALQFDGVDDYVVAETVPAGMDELTMEMWVKYPSRYASAIACAINDNTKKRHVSMSIYYDCADFVLLKEGGFHDSYSRVQIPNRWVHLAGVLREGKELLFVDGQPVPDSKWQDSKNGYNFTGLSLGAAEAEGKYQSFFAGEMREVRISDIARYEEAFDPGRPESRLQADEHTIALYHCNEGAGDVLRDSSGNNHHGEIVGAKWLVVDPPK